MIKEILLVIQIIIAIALVAFVVMQAKGAGVGAAFGGESVVYRSRRGVEKIFHYATIVAATLMVIISLFAVVLDINR